MYISTPYVIQSFIKHREFSSFRESVSKKRTVFPYLASLLCPCSQRRSNDAAKI